MKASPQAEEPPGQPIGGRAGSPNLCSHCGTPLREGLRFCPQCGCRLEAIPPEVEGGRAKPISPLDGLTPQEAPELFQSQREEPREAFGTEGMSSLPAWLDLPPSPGPPMERVPPPHPPTPTIKLPPLPSGLSPAPISPLSPLPQLPPILDAGRVHRLQGLARGGLWSGFGPGCEAQDGERIPLPPEVPSLLLAECRRDITTVALIEAVEGRPRFIAGGQASGDGGPAASIRRACEDIADCTGRRLFDERGLPLIPQQLTGQGVDRLIVAWDMALPPQGPFTPAEDAHCRELLEAAQDGELRAWHKITLAPAPSCLATVIRYLGEAYQANVVGLDLSAAQSWLVAWYEGKLTVVVGGGLSASMEDDEAVEALVAHLWRQWEQPHDLDMVVVRGPVLARGLTPQEIARLLCNVLRPRGVCTFLWDREGLTSPLGAMAAEEPTIAAFLLEGDAFLRLATVIAPVGYPPGRGAAFRFTLIEPGKGRRRGRVAPGELRQISLPPGRSAGLTLRLAPGLSLGQGWAERSARAEIPGGLAGLLLDGRGGPSHKPLGPG